MMFQLGGIFDAAFSLFISSSCVIWVFIILSFILQRDAAGNQTASDGFADVDKPPKTNNTPDPERPLRDTRRDSELDRRSLNDYTNAREGRGRWEGGSKNRLWAEQRPRAPFSLRVYFFKLSLTF